MKVFVSTRATQGDIGGDFCFVPEGELVGRHHIVCDCSKYDDECGCGRAFSGFVSRKGTTSAVVAELDLTEKEWRSALRTSLRAAGWADLMSARELDATIGEFVDHDLREAENFAVGTVLGRRTRRQRGDLIDTLFCRAPAS